MYTFCVIVYASVKYNTLSRNEKTSIFIKSCNIVRHCTVTVHCTWAYLINVDRY